MTNKYLVGASGNHVIVGRPVAGALTREEAMTIAAWLVAIASSLPGAITFEEIQRAVERDG